MLIISWLDLPDLLDLSALPKLSGPHINNRITRIFQLKFYKIPISGLITKIPFGLVLSTMAGISNFCLAIWGLFSFLNKWNMLKYANQIKIITRFRILMHKAKILRKRRLNKRFWTWIRFKIYKPRIIMAQVLYTVQSFYWYCAGLYLFCHMNFDQKRLNFNNAIIAKQIVN